MNPSSIAPLPAAPAATMIPVLNPQVNSANVQNLIPRDSSALYYAENSYKTDPSLVKLYAQMDVNFTYPTVMIENSEYLTELACSTGSLNFVITSQQAYSTIKSTWNSINSLVLIFNGDDCQHTKNDTRSYWLGHVGSVTWTPPTGKGYLSFVGNEILVQQGVKNVELAWGSVGAPFATSSAANVKLNNSTLCNDRYSEAITNESPATNPCTVSFDNNLDAKIGLRYVPSSQRQKDLNDLLLNAYMYSNVIVPYVKHTSGKRQKKDQPPMPARIHLHRRLDLGSIEQIGNGLSNAGSSVASAVASVLNAATSTVSSEVSSAIRHAISVISSAGKQLASEAASLATALANGLESLSNKTVAAIEDFEAEAPSYSAKLESIIANAAIEIADKVNEWEPSGSGQLHINLAPSNLEDSPWGEAYVLFKYPSNKKKRETITAYCVSCGVQGLTHYHGYAKFSIENGVQELHFGMNGTLEFGINIGLDGEVKHRMPKLSFNLTPPQGATIFEIDGVIAVGPILELKASLDADVTGEGKMLAGASLTVPQFSSFFDFVNTANSFARGFEGIQVQRHFAASGGIDTTAIVGLPFSVGVGIKLPAIKLDKQIKLVNVPSITADAQVEVGTTVGKGAPPLEHESKCHDGVDWGVSFANDLYIDYFGLSNTSLIQYHPPPFARGCYKIPGFSDKKVRKKAKVGEMRTMITRTLDERSTLSKEPISANSLPNIVHTNSGMTLSENVASNGSTIAYGTLVRDTTGKFTVVSSADGNLYLQQTTSGTFFQRVIDTSALWTNDITKSAYAASTALVTDDRSRAFFLFPDSLSTFSASRIRVLPLNAVPSNAMQSVLGRGTLASTIPEMYFFASPSDPASAFYPVACSIVDAQSRSRTKLFAVSDLAKGVASLTSNSPAVQAGLTGGVVGQCALVPLVGTYTPNPTPTDPLGKLAAVAKQWGLGDLLKELEQQIAAWLKAALGRWGQKWELP